MKGIELYKNSLLKLFKYPLFTSSCGFVMGIVLRDAFSLNVSITSWLLVIVYLCLFFLINRDKRLFILFLIMIVIGCTRYDIFYNLPKNHISNFNGQEISFDASVSSDTRITRSGTSFAVSVEKVYVNDQEIITNGVVLINTSRYPDYSYGDKVSVTGVLESPENFGEFDYKEYLKTRKIYSITKPHNIDLSSERNTNFNLYRELFKLKKQIGESLKKIVPEPHASLIMGIVLGTRENIPASFSGALSTTGTTHIIAVSGYNVMIVIGILLNTAGFIPKKFSVIFAGIVLLVFLLIVGLNNLPALRAGVMGVAYLASVSLGRRGGIVSFLPLSAAVLIYLNPLSFKDLSFQLSFGSTLGLILFSDFFESKLKKLPSLFRSELAPTLAATFATAPIVLVNFKEISMIGPLVNMIVLPVVPLIMIISAFYLLIMLVSKTVASMISFIVFIPTEYMVRLINLFGSSEYAKLRFDQFNKYFLWFSVVFIIYLALKINVKQSREVDNKK